MMEIPNIEARDIYIFGRFEEKKTNEMFFEEIEPGNFFRGVGQDDIFLKIVSEYCEFGNAIRVESGSLVSFGAKIKVVPVQVTFYEQE